MATTPSSNGMINVHAHGVCSMTSSDGTATTTLSGPTASVGRAAAQNGHAGSPSVSVMAAPTPTRPTKPVTRTASTRESQVIGSETSSGGSSASTARLAETSATTRAALNTSLAG